MSDYKKLNYAIKKHVEKLLAGAIWKELDPKDCPFPAPGITRVWLSHKYLVMQFENESSAIRLSMCRTTVKGGNSLNPIWDDGLVWDEIQAIKQAIGYGDRRAYEVYPEDCKVVNVANLRHIWLPLDDPQIGWYNP